MHKQLTGLHAIVVSCLRKYRIKLLFLARNSLYGFTERNRKQIVFLVLFSSSLLELLFNCELIAPAVETNDSFFPKVKKLICQTTMTMLSLLSGKSISETENFDPYQFVSELPVKHLIIFIKEKKLKDIPDAIQYFASRVCLY